MARMQGAMKAGGAPAPAAAAPAVESVAAPAPPAEPVAKPTPAAPAATPGKKLSPLELARQQGAFKGDKG
jgi:hypothetical protein